MEEKAIAVLWGHWESWLIVRAMTLGLRHKKIDRVAGELSWYWQMTVELTWSQL